MTIEADIEQLKKWIQPIHDCLDLHEWIQDSRPWNAKESVHGKTKIEKCTRYCDHHTEYVKCLCGAIKKAIHSEFEKAEISYNGY